jgi:hypothetical protein
MNKYDPYDQGEAEKIDGLGQKLLVGLFTMIIFTHSLDLEKMISAC